MNEELVTAVENEEEFVDETLVCKECGNEFVFTAGEQKFYKEKGFLNKPKRNFVTICLYFSKERGQTLWIS